jgi:hypothetical protein
VDQEVQIENTLFNPNNFMFYVDIMGNLLSNLKLAFYEGSNEKTFMRKMFYQGNEQQTKENFIKSYKIIRDIYESIASRYRQSQLRNQSCLIEHDR